jgi:hypothetical protein
MCVVLVNLVPMRQTIIIVVHHIDQSWSLTRRLDLGIEVDNVLLELLDVRLRFFELHGELGICRIQCYHSTTIGSSFYCQV